MSIVQFNFPTTIRFGAGGVAELPAYLKNNQLKKPLIATDQTIAGFSFFKEIVAGLAANGVQATVFFDIH
jgi:alcohol dehydrogenase class IV